MSTSTQVPPQQVSTPQSLHVAPPVPQAELLVLDWHLPLESQQPVGQELALQTLVHIPFWQVCPLAQLVAQEPQWLGSLLVFTQVPLQHD